MTMTQPSTYPNIVIAGAPKCGTSSLFRWLADHPAVCGSEPKETFFLMDDGHPLRNRTVDYIKEGWKGYDTFFVHCSTSGSPPLRLEATTHYMYQQTACNALAALADPPHVVFLLRKPSERLYSSYRYTKHNKARLSSDVSFAELVEMIRTDADMSTRCAQPSAYVLERDLRYGRYVDYLDEWCDALGRERLSLVLLDTLKQDPQHVLQQVCRAAGLEASFYDDYDFVRKNKTVHVRFQSVHRIAHSVARWAGDHWLKNAARYLYRAIQTRDASQERTAADCRALAWLEDYYAPHNERLAEHFGLDLSVWRDTPAKTNVVTTE